MMNNDNNELANINVSFDDHFDINVSANDTEILPVIGVQCMVSCTIFVTHKTSSVA